MPKGGAGGGAGAGGEDGMELPEDFASSRGAGAGGGVRMVPPIPFASIGVGNDGDGGVTGGEPGGGTDAVTVNSLEAASTSYPSQHSSNTMNVPS